MAGNDKRLKYRRWLFWEQQGICYLQINQACRQRQGRMWCDVADNGLVLAKSATATFEHVVPKSKSKHTQLILLACFSCNCKKKDAAPSDDHLELAKAMFKRWEKYRAPARASRKVRAANVRNAQLEKEAEHARRRAALGMDVLGVNARQRDKALKRLHASTSRSLGR